MLVDAVYTVVAGRQRRRSYSITCASLSSCGSSMRRTRPGISVKGLKSRREGCWTRDASYIPMVVRRSIALTAGTATTLTLDLVSDDGAQQTTVSEMGVARTLLVVVGEQEGSLYALCRFLVRSQEGRRGKGRLPRRKGRDKSGKRLSESGTRRIHSEGITLQKRVTVGAMRPRNAARTETVAIQHGHEVDSNGGSISHAMFSFASLGGAPLGGA